jgi:hypothetical protein
MGREAFGFLVDRSNKESVVDLCQSTILVQVMSSLFLGGSTITEQIRQTELATLVWQLEKGQ